MRKETVNTFTNGMTFDTNAMNTPNNVLTDVLNGALLTYNGDELMLQNDAGNSQILAFKEVDFYDEEEYYQAGKVIFHEGNYYISTKPSYDSSPHSTSEFWDSFTNLGNYTNFRANYTYKKDNYVMYSGDIYISKDNAPSGYPNFDLSNWDLVGKPGVSLSDGFYPIGMKELGGILYIVSASKDNVFTVFKKDGLFIRENESITFNIALVKNIKYTFTFKSGGKWSPGVKRYLHFGSNPISLDDNFNYYTPKESGEYVLTITNSTGIPLSNEYVMITQKGDVVEVGSFPSTVPILGTENSLNVTINSDIPNIFQNIIYLSDTFGPGDSITFNPMGGDLDSFVSTKLANNYKITKEYKKLYKVRVVHMYKESYQDLTDDVWNQFLIENGGTLTDVDHFLFDGFTYKCPSLFTGKLGIIFEVNSLDVRITEELNVTRFGTNACVGNFSYTIVPSAKVEDRISLWGFLVKITGNDGSEIYKDFIYSPIENEGTESLSFTFPYFDDGGSYSYIVAPYIIPDSNSYLYPNLLEDSKVLFNTIDNVWADYFTTSTPELITVKFNDIDGYYLECEAGAEFIILNQDLFVGGNILYISFEYLGELEVYINPMTTIFPTETSWTKSYVSQVLEIDRNYSIKFIFTEETKIKNFSLLKNMYLDHESVLASSPWVTSVYDFYRYYPDNLKKLIRTGNFIIPENKQASLRLSGQYKYEPKKYIFRTKASVVSVENSLLPLDPNTLDPIDGIKYYHYLLEDTYFETNPISIQVLGWYKINYDNGNVLEVHNTTIHENDLYIGYLNNLMLNSNVFYDTYDEEEPPEIPSTRYLTVNLNRDASITVVDNNSTILSGTKSSKKWVYQIPANSTSLTITAANSPSYTISLTPGDSKIVDYAITDMIYLRPEKVPIDPDFPTPPKTPKDVLGITTDHNGININIYSGGSYKTYTMPAGVRYILITRGLVSVGDTITNGNNVSAGEYDNITNNHTFKKLDGNNSDIIIYNTVQ